VIKTMADTMAGRANVHASRERAFTDVVYGGTDVDRGALRAHAERQDPGPSPYRVYFGEIHGHTELSDGWGTPDACFTAARDLARLDFCALTDHDHGGVGRPELWGEKWELIQQKVAEYHAPGTFVTLLGYERDSFPYYPNMNVYYRGARADMVRGAADGDITADEIAALREREDVLFIPHQISQIEVGVNWKAVPPALMPAVAEIYSKWGASEFMDNPRPIRSTARGNFWQDALELGARIGCIAGSDIHSPFPGLQVDSGHANLRHDQPGIAAVLAPELSREAVFDAIRQRRCYACEGARIKLDFRINGEAMGSELRESGAPERRLWLRVEAPLPLATVTVVKNAQDHFTYHVDGTQREHRAFVTDLEAERATDYYYLRVTQTNGLRAWSSPIWVDATPPQERREG